MKIAILSDIHGNIVALNEVLKDAKSQGVNEYIVLGDMITDFPAANEVVDIIKGLTPYVIKGNREQYLLNYEKTKNDKCWNTIQNISLIYHYHILNDENKEYIRSLPEQLVVEFEGIKIRCVHGSPYYISQALHFNDSLMDRVFDELKEDVLVYGHLHEIVQFEKRNNKYVVHAGVVGMHNNEINKAQYTILTCSDKKVEVEARTVEYDIEEVKEMIYKTDVLEKAKTWQNLCFYAIAKGNDIRTNFTYEAEEQMKKKYEGNCPEKVEKNFIGIDDDIFRETSKKFEKYFLL